MKEKIRNVLHALKIDVLFYTLYAKIALALTKKLTAVKNAVRRFFAYLFPHGQKATTKK